jgi:hypothetical protein
VRLDPLGAERAAQAVHVDLQRSRRGRGRVLAPDLVHEPVTGDDPVPAQEERREQRPLLRRSHGERLAVSENGHRAEDAELRARHDASP